MNITNRLLPSPHSDAAALTGASDWVRRWSHLVAAHGPVLDIACGHGRHMKWFAEKGHPVFGVDRSPEAIGSAARFGEVVLADIENSPWPLMDGDRLRQFQAVIVTHYLWRPLLPTMVQSVAPGGVLIYETFAVGNEAFGKPSNPDFLLQSGELLTVADGLRIVAYEQGLLPQPPRVVQRIAAIRPGRPGQSGAASAAEPDAL